MTPTGKAIHEPTKVEVRKDAAEELQPGEESHPCANQYKSGGLVSSEPGRESQAKRLCEEENSERPHTRGNAGDEQEARQRDAQKACGEICRQAGAGNEPAEDQNGCSPFSK